MLGQTAEYWGSNYFSESFSPREWQARPLALERQYQIQNEQMREVGFAKKYLKNPAARAPGFGRAETKIALLEIGAVEHYDLYDVSPVGLDYAKACAEEKGFGHRVTTHCMSISDASILLAVRSKPILTAAGCMFARLRGAFGGGVNF